MFLFCPTSSTFLSASKGHNANRGVFFLIMSAIRLCYSIDMSHVTERGRRCQRSNCTVKTQYLTAFKPIQLGRRTKQERFSAHFLSACECMCILTNFLFSLFLSLPLPGVCSSRDHDHPPTTGVWKHRERFWQPH